MARYIDADKTLDLMWNALYKFEDDDEKKNGLDIIKRRNIQDGFGIAHKVVVDAPTEDVAPVIHAHWRTKEYGYAILNMDDEVMWLAGVPCSHCGITGQTNWNYCPNCGAKMERKEG